MAAPTFDSVNNNHPSTYAAAVTTSDTVNFSKPCRGLYIGGDGNVVAVMSGDGAAITFVGLTAGTVLPIQATRVNATNTTATNIVALF